MSYGINDNTYTTRKRVSFHDPFRRRTGGIIPEGTDIDSVHASLINVRPEHFKSFEGLTPQEGIDKRIELGYIELKV